MKNKEYKWEIFEQGFDGFMVLEKSLDLLHNKAKQNRLLHYFTAFNRVILAITFILSGMTKLLGNRFT